MILTEDANGQEVPMYGTLKIDGYSIDERLLEGVIFLVDVDKGVADAGSIRVRDDDLKFLDMHDMPKIFTMIEKHLQEHDVFEVHEPLRGKQHEEAWNSDVEFS